MWFRVHTSLLHNQKAQSLSGNLFKAWMNILCLAKEGDGIVPGVLQVAFHLRVKVLQAQKIMDELCALGFFSVEPNGTFLPNDWNEHQYKSDVSTDRVKQFRKRKGNVSRNESETPSETDTETESEQSTETEPKPRASVREIVSLGRFDEWWKIWSDVRGTANRDDAVQAWISVVTPDLVEPCIECTRSYVESLDDPRKGFNPENFIFKQAKDAFSARWPKARDSPTGDRNQKRRDEVLAGIQYFRGMNEPTRSV